MIIEEIKLLDITAPKHLHIKLSADRKTLWINVDGICRFRVCKINNLKLEGLEYESL